MPDIVNENTVTITSSSGSPTTIPNPLLQYNFQNIPLNTGKWANYFPINPPNSGDGYLAEYNHTVRSPDTNLGPSDPGSVNRILEAVDPGSYAVSS